MVWAFMQQLIGFAEMKLSTIEEVRAKEQSSDGDTTSRMKCESKDTNNIQKESQLFDRYPLANNYNEREPKTQ